MDCLNKIRPLQLTYQDKDLDSKEINDKNFNLNKQFFRSNFVNKKSRFN